MRLEYTMEIGDKL